MGMEVTFMKQKTVNLIFCALFTAVIAVCAQIVIPTPFFPITMQAFGIALCGYTLGLKDSAFSVTAYLLLGILGAPIFSGFCGGFHHITDAGGGFVVGFLPLAIFCGIAVNYKNNFKKIIFGIFGLIVMYIFGIAYFCYLTGTKIFSAVLLVFLGVFLKDALSLILALYISKTIRKRMS